MKNIKLKDRTFINLDLVVGYDIAPPHPEDVQDYNENVDQYTETYGLSVTTETLILVMATDMEVLWDKEQHDPDGFTIFENTIEVKPYHPQFRTILSYLEENE